MDILFLKMMNFLVNIFQDYNDRLKLSQTSLAPMALL